MNGSISTNSKGGQDAHIQASKGVGSVFAAGNTKSGPVTTGASVGINANGHGVSMSKSHTPGAIRSTSTNVNLNLVDNGPHKIDANLFKSNNKLPNGFEFKRNGGGLDYSHVNGHSASVGMSKIPNYGKTYEVMGKANLWQSRDASTRLDLTGSGSQVSGGPFNGQKNFGANLGVTHFFK